jgi:hypothetical protein
MFRIVLSDDPGACARRIDHMIQPHAFPPVVGGRSVVRSEAQKWSRSDRAEGSLDLGYDSDDRPVRVEYHWWRWFSRADPTLDDVYTAELWVQRLSGDWVYLLHPGSGVAATVSHDKLRPILIQALGVDIEG